MKIEFIDGYYVGTVNSNGERHGKGTFHFANGDRYEGDWRYDKRHGQGKYYYSNGAQYIGEWRDDKANGEGIYCSPNFDRYEGEFVDGLFHGKGMLFFSNGTLYEGDFREGLFHGKGTYYTNGSVEERKYINGQLVESRLVKTIELSGIENILKNESVSNDTSPSQNNYVFISYSSKDKEYADRVRYLLNDKNIKTWMAPYDIPAGSKYTHVINDAIENCHCMLLILTKNAQASEWVEKEVERAVTYKKAIISIHLDGCQLNSGYRFMLGNQQIVSVKTISSSDSNMKKVLDAIGKL